MRNINCMSFVMLALFAFSFTMISDAYATTYTAVDDGTWEDDATWEKSSPGDVSSDDEVIIPDGITVISSTDVANDGVITVDGELVFLGKLTNNEFGIIDINAKFYIDNRGTLLNDQGTINLNEDSDGIEVAVGGLLENKNTISLITIESSYIDNFGSIINEGTIGTALDFDGTVNNFGIIENREGAYFGNSASFNVANEGGTITNLGIVHAVIEQQEGSLFENTLTGILDCSDCELVNGEGATINNYGLISTLEIENDGVLDNYDTIKVESFSNGGDENAIFVNGQEGHLETNNFENNEMTENNGEIIISDYADNSGTIDNQMYSIINNTGNFENFGTIVNVGEFGNYGTVNDISPITGNPIYELADDDKDGIVNIIDPSPNDDTNYTFDDGNTSGIIVSAGPGLKIYDEASPDGVRIITGDIGDSFISLCGDISGTKIAKNSDVIVTCGSVTWKVISGEITSTLQTGNDDLVELTLTAGDGFYWNDEDSTYESNFGTAELSVVNSDGISAEITITENNTVVYDPGTSTLSASSENIDSIDLTIDGVSSTLKADDTTIVFQETLPVIEVVPEALPVIEVFQETLPVIEVVPEAGKSLEEKLEKVEAKIQKLKEKLEKAEERKQKLEEKQEQEQEQEYTNQKLNKMVEKYQKKANKAYENGKIEKGDKFQAKADKLLLDISNNLSKNNIKENKND